MISGAFLIAGLLIGIGLFDLLLLLLFKRRGKPYELLYVSIPKAIRREASIKYNNLGETPERKLLTVMVGVGSIILRYVVLQYLNALSGLLTLSYVLFFWPINVTPLTRGMIFGVAVLTHMVWVFSRFGEWMDSDDSESNLLLFFWRMPWQLAGGVGFTLWILSGIAAGGDTGLIDTGMGYSLHPLSFIVSPMIIVGLFVGDYIGSILGDLWLVEKDKKEAVAPFELAIGSVKSE